MARPLRIEYPGAIYHVTSRGDRREDIFLTDEDRQVWLDILGKVCNRFNWRVHAFCQMTNHYHLMLETVDGNLSRGMRQLNGWYTQQFNRSHQMVGHLFQGRYKAILVQKESYLSELARYVVLNPLRANMVANLDEWLWSSYPMMTGQAFTPRWLETDWLLGLFGSNRNQAIYGYVKFVMMGKGLASPLEATRHQLLLGDDAFVEKYGQDQQSYELHEIPRKQRKAINLPLSEYRNRYPDRNEAMARAYLTGSYTMAEIGNYFGVHYMTVSRAVHQHEIKENKSC